MKTFVLRSMPIAGSFTMPEATVTAPTLAAALASPEAAALGHVFGAWEIRDGQRIPLNVMSSR